jgi:hypothetical protein
MEPVSHVLPILSGTALPAPAYLPTTWWEKLASSCRRTPPTTALPSFVFPNISRSMGFALSVLPNQVGTAPVVSAIGAFI